MPAPPPEAPGIAGTDGRGPAVWPGWLAATAQAVRFYSRLPMPGMPGETDPHAAPDFRLMPRALPFAALVITLPAMAAVALGAILGLPPLPVAAIGIAALAISTGAFHEDGLADSADGLYGGHSPERRLEIMKDSRIGSYGATALMLALVLRVATLAALMERGGTLAGCMALAAAAPWSRALGIWLLALDPPARAYGAVASVGRPTNATASIAMALSAGIAIFAGLAGGFSPEGVGLGLFLGLLSTIWLRTSSQRLIGGPTGDIAGAAQQFAEISMYIGLVLVAS